MRLEELSEMGDLGKFQKSTKKYLALYLKQKQNIPLYEKQYTKNDEVLNTQYNNILKQYSLGIYIATQLSRIIKI